MRSFYEKNEKKVHFINISDLKILFKSSEHSKKSEKNFISENEGFGEENR